MANRITFQFEDDLDYQMQAIHSTVELFRGLSRHVDGIYRPNRVRKFGEGDPVRNSDIVIGSRLLNNLRDVQLSNHLFADNALAHGNNFTIEMETGTGKTYVYLRTILELYQEYGFKKFMIVVPSVAIRKGVVLLTADFVQNHPVFFVRYQPIFLSARDFFEIPGGHFSIIILSGALIHMQL